MKRLLFCMMVIFLSVSCSTLSLQQASNSYKCNRDYASLETIYKNLKKGMKRSDVEQLLGEPDYSPIEGQYYYSSDRHEHLTGDKDKMMVPLGIIVDYRDVNNKLAGELQTFIMSPIGE